MANCGSAVLSTEDMLLPTVPENRFILPAIPASRTHNLLHRDGPERQGQPGLFLKLSVRTCFIFLWPPFLWIIIQGWKSHAKPSKLQHSLESPPSSLGNLLLLQTKRVTTEKAKHVILLNLTISSVSTMAGDHGKTLWLCHKLQWVWKISGFRWPAKCKNW